MAEPTAWPMFLAPMRAMLETLRVPDAPFDPSGEWRQRYRVCVLAPERGAKGEHPNPYGSLMLSRKPSGEGRFTLDVECSILTRARAGLASTASITCAADRIATPLRWTLRSSAVDAGKPVPQTEVEQSLQRPPGGKPTTSNWTLLEAVQRLPFELPQPVAFDMLEDLDLVKPGQTLRAVAPVTVELSGRKTTLHGFRQIGRGILPTHYWLDDRHRLIAAAGALRAYILDVKETA